MRMPGLPGGRAAGASAEVPAQRDRGVPVPAAGGPGRPIPPGERCCRRVEPDRAVGMEALSLREGVRETWGWLWDPAGRHSQLRNLEPGGMRCAALRERAGALGRRVWQKQELVAVSWCAGESCGDPQVPARRGMRCPAFTPAAC